MRFQMKTSYNDDIKLFRYRGDFCWYLALAAALLISPFILDDYYLSQMSFIAIYSTVAVGLMLLTGFTGQMSLGHAAFFAIGAYASAILTQVWGGFFLPALLASGLISAAAGIAIGLPSLRLTGLYLAITTMAFNFLVVEILTRWKSLTRGNLGMYVDTASMGPITFDTEKSFYYLAITTTALSILAVKNLLRSPAGRAFVAIRDSEIAAQSMGVSLAKFKTMAFAVSAFLAGIAGSLYAHKLSFINPETFNIGVSIEFIAIIIIGGLGSLHGAVFGSCFVLFLPQAIALISPYLPDFISGQNGLQTGVYGLAIILFIRFEPLGIYGRWQKIKFYFNNFPIYKKGTFKRERKYFKAKQH